MVDSDLRDKNLEEAFTKDNGLEEAFTKSLVEYESSTQHIPQQEGYFPDVDTFEAVFKANKAGTSSAIPEDVADKALTEILMESFGDFG